MSFLPMPREIVASEVSTTTLALDLWHFDFQITLFCLQTINRHMFVNAVTFKIG